MATRGIARLRYSGSNLQRELGYRVLEACHGEEALRIAKDHVGPLDLLLTDAVMPGMHGMELAASLKSVRPTPVLLMSGYAGSTHTAVEDGIAYMQKPFTPDGLGCKVRELFDGPPTAPSAGAE